MIFSQDQLPAGWTLLAREERQPLVAKLKKEVSKQHRLWGLHAVALARRGDKNDVLFLIEGAEAPLYAVHLTGIAERSPKWPKATPFASAEDFLTHWKRIFD